MNKKYHRKEFLKLALFAPLTLYGASSWFSTSKSKAAAILSGNNNVDYYKKGDVKYDLLRKGFNKRIDKFPLIIALCKNTDGVAEAVKYAIQNKLPVAVKSGGHCMEGFSCNNGGIVINVSLLNKVEWIDKWTVKIGPGCTLSALYDALLPKGKIIPGGSCAGVAIGGLVLGGGYGLLARRYGLTCDSLQEVTMVDGNGVIRSSRDDKELLWACKGGGNGNFGVITELKFKVSKAPATLQSFRFKTHKVDTARARAILQNWFEATEHLPPACFSAFVLNRRTAYILLTNSGKPTTETENITKKLSAKADKITRPRPQAIAGALKVYYASQTPQYFKNASAGLYKNFSDIDACIDKVIDTVIATPGMIYQVNTLGGNIVQEEFKNASSFPHRDYLYFSELQTYWQKETQGQRLMQRFEAVEKIFLDNGIKAQYRNYASVGFANWEEMYYGNNYSRLQDIKNKYDPGNVIQHEQSVRNK